MGRIRISAAQLGETLAQLRTCGRGKQECQILWVGPWSDPQLVSRIVHPAHYPRGDGFQLSESWLTAFWLDLAARGEGVRAQVHTHPAEAFHSPTDDTWPIVHTPGFFSLVVPWFARSDVALEDCYLTHITSAGSWQEIPIAEGVEVV